MDDIVDFEAAYREHANNVRVRGFVVAMCTEATRAYGQLEQAIARLERARKDAEEMRKHVLWLADQVEMLARVVSSGDKEWVDEVAACLEEIVG